MSESEEKIVQELLDSNEDFKALHVLHGQLKIIFHYSPRSTVTRASFYNIN